MRGLSPRGRRRASDQSAATPIGPTCSRLTPLATPRERALVTRWDGRRIRESARRGDKWEGYVCRAPYTAEPATATVRRDGRNDAAAKSIRPRTSGVRNSTLLIDLLCAENNRLLSPRRRLLKIDGDLVGGEFDCSGSMWARYSSARSQKHSLVSSIDPLRSGSLAAARAGPCTVHPGQPVRGCSNFPWLAWRGQCAG